MNQSQISCDLHDHIEIACMYGYRVRLHLQNNSIVEGEACDIDSIEKREYLVLENAQERRVELTRIVQMEVLTAHAKFKLIKFK